VRARENPKRAISVKDLDDFPNASRPGVFVDPLSPEALSGFESPNVPSNCSAITARLGDELLRHLPLDRRLNAEPLLQAEATYKIAGDQWNQFSQASLVLEAGLDAFLLTTFATLLARLAGQEIVTFRNVTGNSRILSLPFDAEGSFRSLLAMALSTDASLADQPCAIEFDFTSSHLSPTDLPDHALRMTAQVSNAEILVRLASSTDLWDQAVLRLWLRYFDSLLMAAVLAPDTGWKTLPLFDSVDAQQFYKSFNNTAVAYPADLCLHDLVMLQVERAPGSLAVSSDSRNFTYRQLHERSNAIARQLQAMGAGPNRPVVVCIERTAELPVALLGVLKAGSCYVPLDPQNPHQHLMSILGECRPAAILVDSSIHSLRITDATPVVRLEEIPELSTDFESAASGVTADHYAYTIYTSGTTGKPKGVTISHRAVVNLLHSILREPGFTSSDRMLAVASISFDIATMDMFLPLVAGGTLVIADRLVAADPFWLAEMLKRLDINVLQATPATWRMLASSGWRGKRDLRMISGGEALPRDLANELLDLGGELWNCYGPTETTIYSSVLRIQFEKGIVPIGPPIANTTFYVLDNSGRLLPPGVLGELYIGGEGVSFGYLNRPELTDERFLPDPYSRLPGARMFKSGDLVRILNRHEFEFFGRVDQQVKLRGYRIELGEIESALRNFPGIENAVAARREDTPGEPYLIAYFTAGKEQPDLRGLRDYLSQVLPSYMIPSRFVALDAMPLTSSGKIDRKVLPAPKSTDVGIAAFRHPERAEPQTKLEENLLAIFREVLNVREFGVTDSFFDFGGYSLLTVKLFTRINRTLNLSLPISLLFDAPRVRALAKIIDNGESLSTIVPIRPWGRSTPLFVIHSYLLYGVLPKIVEQDRPVYGVREVLNAPEAQSVQDRAMMYMKEILKISSNGPLLLAGWCAAGSLTVEIARQLRELGHEVGLVALFDAERPGYRRPNSWTDRLISSLKFHSNRLRRINGREKFGYARDMLHHRCDAMLEALFMRHRRMALILQRVFGFALPEAAFNNTWSSIAANLNYTSAKYAGRVMLFRATDVPQLPDADKTLGWKEIVEDSVEVIFVPGDHESMFHDPHVAFLSGHLRQALQLSD
jgi:amino acid adenylation domain-containing protein